MWGVLHAIQNAVLGVSAGRVAMMARMDALEHRISTRIFLMEKRLMAKIDDLNAILTVVEADVAAVVADLAAAGPTVDLEPAITKLTAISGTLKAAHDAANPLPPAAA